MSKLMQSLMKDIKADGDGKFGIVAKDKVMIKTGFDMLDYHNGYYTSDNKIKLGVSSSNMIYLIGKSGVGKTTFGIQVANSLISDFKNGSCFILDFESANSKDRVMAVTGLSDKEYTKLFIIFFV